MKIKKVKDKVEYYCFGKLYEIPDNERKERAIKYAEVLKMFENIGAGADECLQDTRMIVGLLKKVCEFETGYEIEY